MVILLEVQTEPSECTVLVVPWGSDVVYLEQKLLLALLLTVNRLFNLLPLMIRTFRIENRQCFLLSTFRRSHLSKINQYV